MTKLEKLINELCPNGVEYKKLKEVSEMKRGTSVTKKDITEGDIPVISGGREPAYYCDKYNRDGETITVAGSGAGAGYVQYWTKPIFVCDAFSVKGLEFIQTKYLYYCLANMQEVIYSTKKGSGVPHVHISCIENFKIPTPPIEVQREIVRILDNFTEITTELNEKLSEELTARKKQYEYYRDSLLTFGDDVPMVKLGELCSLVTKQTGFDYSNHIKDNLLIKEKDGAVPYIQTKFFTGKNFDYNTDYFVPKEIVNRFPKITLDSKCLLFSIVGASIGNVGLFPNDKTCFLGGAICVAKVKQEYNIDYLYYCIESNNVQHQIKKKTKGAGQATITVEDIREFTVPLPPMEVQCEIVRILNNFSNLCTDISTGLPAEIEARKKQYEYYRDKLLTFKELSV